MDHGCTGCLGASWPGCGSVRLALGFSLGPDLSHVTLILLGPVDLPLTFLSRQRLDTKGVKRNMRCFLGFQKTYPPIVYWFKQVTGMMPSSLVEEEGHPLLGSSAKMRPEGGMKNRECQWELIFKAEGCSYLLLGSARSHEMLSPPVPLEVRACDIPLQCLSLCPQVINQPTHSQLEKDHDARRPRSVSCQSTAQLLLPNETKSSRKYNPEAFLQYIFLPKLNFWSTLEAVWHSQNYEGKVDKQPKPALWTHHTPKLNLHPPSKKTGCHNPWDTLEFKFKAFWSRIGFKK